LRLAAAMGRTVDEVANATRRNAERVFSLPTD